MPHRTLEQLFLAYLRDGDELAFEQLLRRSAPALRRLARRLGADAEEAEDLIQETIVAAIDSAERFTPERPLLPWLKGILTFRAAKLARGRVRRRRWFGELPPEPVAAGRSPIDGVADQELARDVRAAIAQLPAPFQAPMQQFLLQGRTPRQIAQSLGAARATVRVRLHRGLARLRGLLARWGAVLVALLAGPQLPARSARQVGSRGLPAMLVAAIAVAVGCGAFGMLMDAPSPVDLDRAGTAVATAAATNEVGGPAPLVAAAVAQRGLVTPVELAVQIVDHEGRPAPNVAVALRPDDGRDPVVQRRIVVTDARGRAGFSMAEPGAVCVTTDRGAACTAMWPDDGPLLRLQLGEGATVRGQVVDADGQGVGGASVWLSDDATGPWRGTDVTTADASGAFLLQHVRPGAFVAARHSVLARSEAVRVAADAAPMRLQLRGLGGSVTVTVAVVGVHGGAVPDVQVFVGEAMDAAPLWLAQGAAPWRAPPFTGRTGAAGTFGSLALEPGRHQVAVRGAGVVPQLAWVDVERGRNAALRLQVVPGDTVRGRVVGADGRPMAAVVVLRTGDPHHSVDVATDAAGGFRFDGVGAGCVDVAARAPGHEPAVVVAEVAAHSACTIELRLSPERAVVGRLVRLDGGPPNACEVRAEWPPSALVPGTRVAVVDAGGSFRLVASCAAAPRFSVRLPGDLLWQRVEARPDGPALHIEVPPDFALRSALRGTLRSDAGAPLAAARVFLHREGQAWSEVGCTDAAGAFTCAPVPPGRYVVFAETTDRQLPTLVLPAIQLAPGEQREVHEAAPACGAVEVELLRTDGAPVGDLAVTLVDTQWQRRACIATTARFRQVLVPGSYQLHVMGSRVRWRENVPLAITAGRTSTLRVLLEPAVRYTISLSGLPAMELRTAAVVVLRQRRTDWSAQFTLPADAPLRLAAMLAPGDYDLVYADATGCEWRGALQCSGDEREARSLVVPVVVR